MTEEKPCLPAGRGVWVAIEGNDGSGKTDQVKRLGDYLKGLGLPAHISKEPGGTNNSDLDKLRNDIRKVIFNPLLADKPIAQLFLLVADRHLHVNEDIEHVIDNGGIALSDRSEGATLAYQAGQYGLDFETVKNINDYATGGLRPHLTVLLDIDEQLGWDRKHQSKEGQSNYFDFADMASLTRRRKMYLFCAKNYEDLNLNPWVIVDASGTKDEVFDSILKAIKERGVIKGL